MLNFHESIKTFDSYIAYLNDYLSKAPHSVKPQLIQQEIDFLEEKQSNRDIFHHHPSELHTYLFWLHAKRQQIAYQKAASHSDVNRSQYEIFANQSLDYENIAVKIKMHLLHDKVCTVDEKKSDLEQRLKEEYEQTLSTLYWHQLYSDLKLCLEKQDKNEPFSPINSSEFKEKTWIKFFNILMKEDAFRNLDVLILIQKHATLSDVYLNERGAIYQILDKSYERSLVTQLDATQALQVSISYANESDHNLDTADYIKEIILAGDNNSLNSLSLRQLFTLYLSIEEGDNEKYLNCLISSMSGVNASVDVAKTLSYINEEGMLTKDKKPLNDYISMYLSLRNTDNKYEKGVLLRAIQNYFPTFQMDQNAQYAAFISLAQQNNTLSTSNVNYLITMYNSLLENASKKKEDVQKSPSQITYEEEIKILRKTIQGLAPSLFPSDDTDKRTIHKQNSDEMSPLPYVPRMLQETDIIKGFYQFLEASKISIDEAPHPVKTTSTGLKYLKTPCFENKEGFLIRDFTVSEDEIFNAYPDEEKEKFSHHDESSFIYKNINDHDNHLEDAVINTNHAYLPLTKYFNSRDENHIHPTHFLTKTLEELTASKAAILDKETALTHFKPQASLTPSASPLTAPLYSVLENYNATLETLLQRNNAPSITQQIHARQTAVNTLENYINRREAALLYIQKQINSMLTALKNSPTIAPFEKGYLKHLTLSNNNLETHISDYISALSPKKDNPDTVISKADSKSHFQKRALLEHILVLLSRQKIQLTITQTTALDIVKDIEKHAPTLRELGFIQSIKSILLSPIKWFFKQCDWKTQNSFWFREDERVVMHLQKEINTTHSRIMNSLQMPKTALSNEESGFIEYEHNEHPVAQARAEITMT